jgi:ribulose-phosphate 3-epimerase
MNTNIIPAIMPERFEDIETQTGLVLNQVRVVQLDIMDGKYVSEKTWPFIYGADRDLAELQTEEGSLPFWEDINYELDLMIERPEESLDTWLHIGASRVIFHYASIHDWEKIKNIDHVIRNFIKIGCAVTIHDKLEDIYSLIDEDVIDFIQVMGIADIGYQGEPFADESLDMIEELKKRYPDLLISVDGGVSIDTIGDLSLAGVERFVSGSGIYGGGVASENIAHLESLIEEK